jgi:hypothetical protein
MALSMAHSTVATTQYPNIRDDVPRSFGIGNNWFAMFASSGRN